MVQRKNIFYRSIYRKSNTIFPLVNSLECISCSSSNLAACATTSGTLPSTTCAEGIDTCFTYVQGVCENLNLIFEEANAMVELNKLRKACL